MKKNKWIIGAGILALLLVGTGIAGAVLFLNHPFKVAKPTYVYIDKDDTRDSVYAKLEHDLHASTLRGFKMLVSLSNSREVHPGAYRFDAGDNTLSAFRRVRGGLQTPVKLTIPHVRTVGKLLHVVSRQLMADSASLAALLADSAYCARLGYNAETLPALFIPNTYEVYWTITPDDFVKRMQKEHDLFWNAARKEQARRIGFTPVEVTTLASIVEEETADQAEKPLIAGLYINRLHAGMPLQADPTVKFGLQQFALRRILHEHLLSDSPYNTYKHTGLPPGPICIPSVKGIESVLNYTHHDYLYMCAKEDFSGTHNFAATFAEHQANARRYRQALDQRNIH